MGLLGAPLVSCGLADNLADVGSSLGNPDAALLDSPGRKLASGSFHDLLIDGSLGDGGHVIALERLEEGERLAILPYLEGEPCFIAPATDFDRLSSRIDVELPGVLSVQHNSDEAGRGDISFVDFSCKEAIAGLTGSTTPRVSFPANAPQGLLALDNDDQLILVDPSQKTSQPVASGVTQARSSLNLLWTIENERLVVRDEKLEVLAEVGSKVTGFVTTGGTKVSVAFEDENGLSVWSEVDGVRLLAEDACGAVTWGIDTVAYYAPCEEQRLQIHTVGERLGLAHDFVDISGPAGVRELSRGTIYWGSGSRATEVTLLAEPKQGEGSALVLGSLDVDSDSEESEFQLETTVLVEERARVEQANLYRDWDGETGTLLALERDDAGNVEGLEEIAQKVAQLPASSPYSLRGVLVNFSEGLGELRVYQKEGESTLLATGVPRQSQTVEAETGRLAFVGEAVDEYRGSLFLTAASDNQTPDQAPQKIDDYVHIDTARFLDQPRALAYLARPPGAEFAELRVWLIDAGLKLTVHQAVSEYRTVPWPAPGILYAVPEGKDQGLWFSKAR